MYRKHRLDEGFIVFGRTLSLFDRVIKLWPYERSVHKHKDIHILFFNYLDRLR
jgi:hypothetical protein